MGGYNLNPESANIEDVVNQAGTPQAPPAQPPTQAPQQQAPQPDQIKQGLDTAAQYYQQQVQANTPKPASGGPIRSLLQNFFSGMGSSMMSEAGLPTPYEKQQKALAGLQGVANSQGMLDLHEQMAAANRMVPLVNLDGSMVKGPDGKPVLLPASHAAPWYSAVQSAGARVQAADAAAGARVQAADISVHKPITVPGIGAFNWDDQQNKYVPVGGGQIPQHQLAPGEAEKLGFPSGITQIPEALYATATRLNGTTSTQTKFLPDGAGGFIVVQGTSTRNFNGAPQGGGTIPAAGTPRGGGTTPAAGAQGGGTGTPRASGGARGYIPGNGSVYGYDPKTHDTVMTTPGEAQQNGYTNLRKVTQGQIETDRQLNNRLYDVATKVSRYDDSLNAPISEKERGNIAGLLSSDKLKVGAFGAELPVDRLNQILDVENMSSLSPAARNRLISYYNARESMMGYTRVLSGSASSSDTNLHLNLQALLPPIMPEAATKDSLRQFKENIGIAGQGLPRMPGIQRAQDVLGASGTPYRSPSAQGSRANGGNSAPTMRFNEGGDIYDIPADKVEAFKAKHPQAVPNGR